MSAAVLVFSERRAVALELVSAARELLAVEGGEVAVALAVDGEPGAEEHARELGEQGADRVHLAGAGGRSCEPDVLLAVLDGAVAVERPRVVLIGGTRAGTEIAARLAQRRGAGCATDCSALELVDGELEVERNVLGRFVARQRLAGPLAIATLAPHRSPRAAPTPGRSALVQPLLVEPPPCRVRVLETSPREAAGERVDHAGIVVAVGRGLKERDGLGLVAALARALGGAVAGSRPLTDDLKWLPLEAKVGLSGLSVRPGLYLACGISGQVEHVVGMRESGVVVAVNTDEAAPMMEQADYQVVADLREFLPALTAEIERLRG